LRFLGSLKT